MKVLMEIVAGIIGYVAIRIAFSKRGRISLFGIGFGWRN